jgi:hypothetical protein
MVLLQMPACLAPTSTWKVSPLENHGEAREGVFKQLAPSNLERMKSDSAKDEEVMRRIDSLMQDPNKWEDYIASRVERVLKHWPRR